MADHPVIRQLETHGELQSSVPEALCAQCNEQVDDRHYVFIDPTDGTEYKVHEECLKDLLKDLGYLRVDYLV